MIRVFIGTDRSQLLATKVLMHSIKDNTKHEISVESLDNSKTPSPVDIRQSQRTGFSFARWGIPEVCKYNGKAIYLDADMLLFSDISELWNIKMEGATISIVDGTDPAFTSKGVSLNVNETSVMLINCEKASWSLKKLINGLDGEYTYDEMMSNLCFLKEADISRNIPRSWNSMDYWDENSDLVHFTNVPTQPWVNLDNPVGYVWVNYLKKMIKDNYITLEEVQKEIDLGYIRPSLGVELKGETAMPSNPSYIEKLKRLDSKNKYIPHREVQEWNKRKSKAIHAYESKLALRDGLGTYIIFQLKIFLNAIRHQIRSY